MVPIILDPTAEFREWDGTGVQLQRSTEYNTATYLTAPEQAALFEAGFGAGGIRMARGYLCSGAFLEQVRNYAGVTGIAWDNDGGTDYWTMTGPLWDTAARTAPTSEAEITALLDVEFARTFGGKTGRQRMTEEFVAPMLRAKAANPNLEVFISNASPPAWMKTGFNSEAVLDANGKPVPGTAGRINPAFFATLAAYMVRGLQFYLDAGVPVRYFAPQNEYEVDGPYPTCLWSSTELVTFVRDHLWPRMVSSGLSSTVKLWMGEENFSNANNTKSQVDQLIGANVPVAGAAYHYYAGTAGSMSALLNAKPNVKLHMTEWRTLISQSRADMHETLWRDKLIPFIDAGGNSFGLFVYLLDGQGLPANAYNTNRRGVVTVNSANGQLTYNPEFHLLTGIGRLAPPGGKTIRSHLIVTEAGDNRYLLSSHFKNVDGSITTALYSPYTTAQTFDVIDAVTGQRMPLTLQPKQVGLLKTVTAALGTKALPVTLNGGTGSDTQVVLSLTVPADANRKAIVIARRKASGESQPTSRIPIMVIPDDGTAKTFTVTDTRVATGTSYVYAAAAIGNGVSAYTADSASITTTGSAGGDVTAPTITSANAFSQPENAALNISLTANEQVSWAITGGADEALFTLAGNTLSLAARDFEAPTDLDKNNTYVVQVTATDLAGNSTNQTITVTITDVASEGGTPAPTPLFRDTFTPATNAGAGPEPLNNGGHVSDSGHTWTGKTTLGPGTMTIGSSGVTYANNPAGSQSDFVPPVNARVKAVFARQSTGTGNTAGVDIRGVSGADTSYPLTFNNSSGLLAISRKVAGSNSVLGSTSYTTTTFAGGTTKEVEVEIANLDASGSVTTSTDPTVAVSVRIRLFVGGVQIGSDIIDNSTSRILSAGLVGVKNATVGTTNTSGAGVSELSVFNL